MIKIKQKILLIIVSILFPIGNSYATECAVNISNESQETLSGYTLRVQVAGESKSLYTQTIDLSKVQPLNTQTFLLSSNFTDKLALGTLGDNKTCISLCDPQGKSMTECLILDWKLINHFPVLQIKINAHKKLASVDSPQDVFGMALLAAPAA